MSPSYRHDNDNIIQNIGVNSFPVVTPVEPKREC